MVQIVNIMNSPCYTTPTVQYSAMVRYNVVAVGQDMTSGSDRVRSTVCN